ncbi:hypothetical protein [Streptosporangium roseum]|uniref:hypothetical protein n=1 Tax=Streptosporangium roseum TaxID=2001 RepID=UPI0004CC974F|nr:hypothetical protein [Streptosporangium roseum]
MSDDAMTTYGEFAILAPLLALHERLEAAALDADLFWVLPPDVLAGVTKVYGIPVIRAEVAAPLLAHRPGAS